MDNVQPHDQDSANKTNNNNSSYLCRQSSTRWTPTSDQIRILKELYYNNGIRSPTADQIQRIAARLRHYGKIEGKNVFYWFQNHKARERQKKRLTPVPPPPPPAPSDHHHHHMQIQSHHLPYFYNHQPLKLHATHHISPHEGGSSSSSQVFLPMEYNYGALNMEKSFRDCSISPAENMIPRGEIHNFRSWAGVYSSSFDEMKPENETAEEDSDGGELSTQMETLPLFPIPDGSGSGSQIDFFKMNESASSEHSNGGFYTGGNWYRNDGLTSLELSLKSYGYYD